VNSKFEFNTIKDEYFVVDLVDVRIQLKKLIEYEFEIDAEFKI
jgi:hypothetical protein